MFASVSLQTLTNWCWKGIRKTIVYKFIKFLIAFLKIMFSFNCILKMLFFQTPRFEPVDTDTVVLNPLGSQRFGLYG
jgi:hypothetical protein